VFRSLQELRDAIHRFLDDTNADPKPFTWTKDPNKIIVAVYFNVDGDMLWIISACSSIQSIPGTEATCSLPRPEGLSGGQ